MYSFPILVFYITYTGSSFFQLSRKIAMPRIFCLKCQKKTESKNIRYVKMGPRQRVACYCTVCDSKKSNFVKKHFWYPEKEHDIHINYRNTNSYNEQLWLMYIHNENKLFFPIYKYSNFTYLNNFCNSARWVRKIDSNLREKSF